MTTTNRLSWLGALLIMLLAVPAAAQSNPCNPCGAKAANPCNPCGAKNPCNPCGAMGKAKGAKVAVNPCFAKHGTVFHISDPMGRNTVTFNSKAPLEDIVGTSNDLSGYLVMNPNAPTLGVKGEVVVPVASLNTGIPLRDEHMRSPDWMGAEANPYISFKIDGARNVRQVRSSDAFKTSDMTLLGDFTVNGVTRRVEVPARVTYLAESPQTRQSMPGNLLAVRAEFAVPLRDHNIDGGSMGQVIGTKLSDTIAVEVSLRASDAAGSAANPCNPCNPCGAKNPCNPCGAKNPCNPCAGK